MTILGPIVRIGPNQHRCDDPAFVDEIYASSGRKRDKQAHNLGLLIGLTVESSLGIIDQDLHRVRRSVMYKFFSRAQIMVLEPGVREVTQSFCEKLLSKQVLFFCSPILKLFCVICTSTHLPRFLPMISLQGMEIWKGFDRLVVRESDPRSFQHNNSVQLFLHRNYQYLLLR